MNKYVVDTNVLIGNPGILEQLENLSVILPSTVIWELDNNKDKYGARTAIRFIESLRQRGSLYLGVNTDKKTNIKTIMMAHNGLVSLQPDDIILSCAQQNNAAIVTDDVNVRLKADFLKIPAFPSETILPKKQLVYIHNETSDPDLSLVVNNGIVFWNGLPFRKRADGSLIKIEEQSIFNVDAKNTEQTCAIELMMDPAIELVSLCGKAGTGKSFIALAAALELTLKKKQFERIVIVKPIVSVGKDIGFLPGSLEEKMQSWSISIMDILENLLESKHFGVDCLIEAGTIEIIPPVHLRGQTFNDTIVVVDEAQNLSRHEIKTIVTRMGQNSKIVLTGDTKQIDSQMTELDNGFSYLMGKFMGQDIVGTVELIKTERSGLSALAADLL